MADNVIDELKRARFSGILTCGEISKAVCEINVDLNKIGLVLVGGLNPVAAAAEAGIESENHSMSTVVDYKELVDYRGVFKQ